MGSILSRGSALRSASPPLRGRSAACGRAGATESSPSRASTSRIRFRTVARPMSDPSAWRRCSSCKKPIAFGALYWTCSVSTCNQKRTGLAFCTVSCWDAHLPVARHREAWAEEHTAPKAAEASRALGSAAEKQRRIVRPGAQPAQAAPGTDEVLVIAARVKDYVRAKSGYNTSDRVMVPLSRIVRRVCDEAIRSAQRGGRLTVLDRDIPEE